MRGAACSWLALCTTWRLGHRSITCGSHVLWCADDSGNGTGWQPWQVVLPHLPRVTASSAVYVYSIYTQRSPVRNRKVSLLALSIDSDLKWHRLATWIPIMLFVQILSLWDYRGYTKSCGLSVYLYFYFFSICLFSQQFIIVDQTYLRRDSLSSSWFFCFLFFPKAVMVTECWWLQWR